jgi:hypothetical protein
VGRRTLVHRISVPVVGLMASAITHYVLYSVALLFVSLSVAAIYSPSFGPFGPTVKCAQDVAWNFLLERGGACSSTLGGEILAKTIEVAMLLYLFSFLCDLILGYTGLIRTGHVLARVGAARSSGVVEDANQVARILHISDLHIVADESCTRCEAPNGPKGNRLVESRLRALVPSMECADAVVITGDITDTGAQAEWIEVIRIFDGLPDVARAKLFLVPGNHDLNLVEPRLFRHSETYDGSGRTFRSILFMLAVRSIQGERCDVAEISATEDISYRPMIQVLDPLAPHISSSLNAIEKGGMLPFFRFDLSRIFPFSWYINVEGGRKIAIVAIDTCTVSGSVIDNAIGGFDRRAIKVVIGDLVKQGVFPILVGHHHMLPLFELDHVATADAPTRRGTARRLRAIWSVIKKNSQLLFLAAKDGVNTYRDLRAVASSTGYMYLHGHRHVTRHTSESLSGGANVHIAGAPSLLFGDEYLRDPTCICMMHTLSLSKTSGEAGEVGHITVSTSVVFDIQENLIGLRMAVP